METGTVLGMEISSDMAIAAGVFLKKIERANIFSY
jgi:hypothetical protein